MATSAGFEPARTRLVRLMVAVSLLIRVTVSTWLGVWRRDVCTASLVGAKVTAGTIPVPASDTDCGLPGASSVMVTVAVRALAAVGVNVRLTRQLAPATTVAPFVQVVPAAMAKEPGSTRVNSIQGSIRVAVPLLDRVTVCAGLVVLRRRVPNSRLVVPKGPPGAILLPYTTLFRSLPGASSVMVTVAVRALAAVGVNVRLTRQLAPATTVAAFVQVVPAAMAKDRKSVV